MWCERNLQKGGVNLNPFIKNTIIIVISIGIFTLLLNKLYKANPKIFFVIGKIPEGWKGKWFIRWTVLLFLISISAVLIIIGSNEIIVTIISGFFIALTDLIFSKPKKMN